MTIHRSQPTSAAAVMPGDFVRLLSPRGASYPFGPQIAAAAALISSGMFGTIARQGDQTVLVPDQRIPDTIRELGPLTLSEGATIERVSVDHEHEKAIMAFQYLRQISDVVRERATQPDGTVQRGFMAALMGPAAGADLRRIADELTAAGIQVVEKKVVRTVESTTVFLTADPQAVREGRQAADTMTFATPAQDATSETFEVFDASRTRELLLSAQPVREVAEQPGEIAPVLPAAHTNIMRTLGLEGLTGLTADDIGLGHDFPPEEDEPEGPGMR